jgi:hypothetical protein
MTHPLHPASDTYRELHDAGRAGSVEHRTGADLSPIADPTLCNRESWEHSGNCNELGVAVTWNRDVAGPVVAVCRSHALELMKVPYFVVRWTTECSSCGTSARHYQLDASGRCDECRP